MCRDLNIRPQEQRIPSPSTIAVRSSEYPDGCLGSGAPRCGDWDRVVARGVRDLCRPMKWTSSSLLGTDAVLVHPALRGAPGRAN